MEMLTICSASSHRHFFSLFISKSLISDSFQASILPPKFHPLRRPLPFRLLSNRTTRPPLSISAVPRPPSPPEPVPPGLVGEMNRFQDHARIFFAVLFWMSLFFWYSAWDGRNSGKPNKGSGFRR
ncbi:putative Tetratricopeptide repeat-like superfamily protein [Hibiscus syriacus]|uniref:Tetratricopeptide repeat-like superfamily protein n=1 Tax=Hibiscus syriacus TaxID=106335 RepID=A0A6A2X734_HIBSY|nr:uncharacterized protein LOC120185616 [Hibiscus syriacus]KAE8662945.1 putative Tetratricopeptide repeat-like superfamily protein [Hibiscus syriacus]